MDARNLAGTVVARVKSLALTVWAQVKPYFNIVGDLQPQAETEAAIRAGVSFKGTQLLILMFAIIVACLGLNTDSTAVLIGAMLISPLMGPIIGMGLGVGISDFSLVRRGFKNILMAMVGSILASAIYFLISPQYEGGSQLLARTSPSIYDVFIALFGGAAGIVGLASKNKGQVIPGVAIATSLMPPLCTVGYGLATWQSTYFFGALYLFFTNMIFILFATWIGVKLMHFKPVVYKDAVIAKRVQTSVYVAVTITIGLSAYLTINMINTSMFISEANSFVANEMVFPNTQVLNHKCYIQGGDRYIDVTLIGQALPKDSLQLAMLEKLDSVGLGGTILNIKQGFALGQSSSPNQTVGQLYDAMRSDILGKQAVIDSLKQVIDLRTGFDEEGLKLAPEIKVIFPQVRDVALSNMVLASTQTEAHDTVNMVFLRVEGAFSQADEERLAEYVSVRLHKKRVNVSVNPHSFPWPQP